jgi:hypothetical protein
MSRFPKGSDAGSDPTVVTTDAPEFSFVAAFDRAARGRLPFHADHSRIRFAQPRPDARSRRRSDCTGSRPPCPGLGLGK